jgi:tetratricopeptide (TPR) repeat protein
MNPPDLDRHITELWDDLPNHTGTAKAEHLMVLADHLMKADRHREALPVLETAEELCIEGSVQWLAGRAAHNRAVVLGELGRPAEQLEAERVSIARYLADDRRDLAGCSRMALAFHLRTAGRLAEATKTFEAALDDFTATRERGHRAQALLSLLETELLRGRYRMAQRLLPKTHEAAAQAAPVADVARFHELAAEVLLARHGSRLAIRATRKARAVWDALDDEEQVARCDILLATLELQTGASDLDELERRFLDLRAERQLADDPAGVARCDLGLGHLVVARGLDDLALPRFEDAATVFDACALVADAAEAEAHAAACLGRLDPSPESVGRLRAAAAQLRRLHRTRGELGARLELAAMLRAVGDDLAASAEEKRAEAIVARSGIVPPGPPR